MRKTLLISRLCVGALTAATLCVALPARASRVLTDETGRTVTVPDHPHRIICLTPSVTDTVYAIGAGDEVVAISDYTKYPKAALTKPSVGDLIHPSIERILAFHPDLVIGSAPMGPSETSKQLERLGVAVYLVNPQGIAGILHAIHRISQIANRM
jgi:iron complex transport system substrate-binding protein